MQGEGLKKLQSGQPISTREQLLLIAQLSWPAILAQISSVVMQYIDTAMVGQLGSNASAAIGVVATTSWLFGDLCIALTIGFNVAVAQALGARQSEKARGIMKLAFLVCMAFSLVMMAIALGITGNLPRWLRADPAIWQDASAYFLVFVLSLPFMQLNNLCGGLLRSAGNMKTPGICMVVMCLLDVVFNAFLIFPSGTLRVLGVTLPGFGLGVLGASMGTALSQVVIAVVLTYILLVRSPELHLRRGEKARFTAAQLKRCLSISAPVMGERTILSTARMVTTAIVAPLGIIATAANSFAITAESLCYMSAFGVQAAASTLSGLALGEKDEKKLDCVSRMALAISVLLMTITGSVLVLFPEAMMSIFTADRAVIESGGRILRIVACSEPLYGAMIIFEGVYHGVGQTKYPFAVALATMWIARIGGTLLCLRGFHLGLTAVWLCMVADNVSRAILLGIRYYSGRWKRSLDLRRETPCS